MSGKRTREVTACRSVNHKNIFAIPETLVNCSICVHVCYRETAIVDLPTGR